MDISSMNLSELTIAKLGISNAAVMDGFSSFYATDNLMLIVLVTLGGASAIGHLLDRALGKLAFGMAGNSFLVLMGIIVAVSIGRTHVTLISYDESARIAILASSLSTGLVLGLGALKAYVVRCRI